MSAFTVTTIGDSAVASAGETTCFLVEIAGFRMLVDAGTNPVKALNSLGVGIATIDLVMISHVHADHMQGLATIVFSRFLETRGDPDSKPLRILSNAETAEAARTVLASYYPERSFDLEWLTGEFSAPLRLGLLSAKLFRVEHTVATDGLVLSMDGRPQIGYTSDTALSDQLAEDLRGVNLLIVECFGHSDQFAATAKAGRHLTAEQAASLAARLDVAAAIPFHMHSPYQLDPSKRSTLLADLRKWAPTVSWHGAGPHAVASIDVE